MAKKRIVLSLEGTPKTEQIVWYKGTAQKDILNSIREVSYRATLLLYFEVILEVNRLARSKQYLLILFLFCLFEDVVHYMLLCPYSLIKCPFTFHLKLDRNEICIKELVSFLAFY